MSHCKLFSLKKRRSKEMMKVVKVEATGAFAPRGAKWVEFSPDSRHLLVVHEDNSINLHSIQSDATVKSGFKVHGVPQRLDRKNVRLAEQRPQQGTHGEYERCVCRAAWSNDSKIVVVGDLAGRLDVWHLVEPSNSSPAVADDNKDASSISDDSSDASSSSGRKEPNIDGPRWIRTKAQLPKLQSAPLILSFRPPAPLVSQAEHSIHTPHGAHNQLANGNALDATNGTHEETTTDRLLVVTAMHQVLEFHALAGRRTDWSRRNPPARLPAEFRAVRDRAMGCLWDVAAHGRVRAWLYGVSWLWMFDLSRDLPDPPAEPPTNEPGDDAALTGAERNRTDGSRKRKRENGEERRRLLMARTSGAGSRTPAHEALSGIAHTVRTRVGDEGQEQRSLADVNDQRIAATNDDDSDEEMMDATQESSALADFRRAETSAPTHGEAEHAKRPEAHFWRTYKYRPILGIVPLSRAQGQGPEDTDDHALVRNESGGVPGAGLEVALVERPLWDADLPPRWEGEQEWSGY